MGGSAPPSPAQGRGFRQTPGPSSQSPGTNRAEAEARGRAGVLHQKGQTRGAGRRGPGRLRPSLCHPRHLPRGVPELRKCDAPWSQQKRLQGGRLQHPCPRLVANGGLPLQGGHTPLASTPPPPRAVSSSVRCFCGKTQNQPATTAPRALGKKRQTPRTETGRSAPAAGPAPATRPCTGVARHAKLRFPCASQPRPDARVKTIK